ncbi:MAG: NADH-quinone oxidoreductase subunit C [Actinomycetes bacterium]
MTDSPATVEVQRDRWVDSLSAAHGAGAHFFDFLTAYDELDQGFVVLVHLSTPDAHDHVIISTRVARDDPRLATVTSVYRGAAWHERETHEMFGIEFVGAERDDPLLLPAGFGAHPLRKDFVLAARVARPWPGGVEPDEDVSKRARRRPLPPGVPADWPRLEGGETP